MIAQAVELARRTVLTGWVLLLDESDSFSRLLIALLVSVAFFALLLSVRPYARPVDDLIASLSQVHAT